MSALRLGVLVLAGAVYCTAFSLTKHPDTPDYVRAANAIRDQLKQHMDNEFVSVKEAISAVEATVREGCRGGIVIDTPAIPPEFPFPDTETVTNKLGALDWKLTQALERIEALENELDEKVGPLAKSEELQSLKTDVVEILSEKMEDMNQIEGILTKAQVEEVFKEDLEGVKEELVEVKESCASGSAIMTELLQKVDAVKENVGEVKVEVAATKGGMEQCLAQNTTEAVTGVKVLVEEMGEKVEELGDYLGKNILTITEIVDVLADSTRNLTNTVQEEMDELQQQAVTTTTTTATPTTTTTPTGPIYPCEDSTFIGTRSNQVCPLAVRFNRCHLGSVSYHCCHTCTTKGQLPEYGPWRHLNLTRTVTSLQVIRFFAP